MNRVLKAVLVGSAVVAGPLTLVSGFIAVLHGIDQWNRGDSLWSAVAIASMPVAIVVPIVALATVLIGLPIDAVLRNRRQAGDLAYSAAGGLVGFALPALPMLIDRTVDTFWMALLGLVGGAVTGHVWWKGRPRG